MTAALAATGCSNVAFEHRPLELARQQSEKAALTETTFQEAESLIAQQRWSEALGRLAPLEKVFAEAGDRTKAANVVFWMAFCTEKQGRAPQAADLYGRLGREYPQTPAARLAAERLSRISSEKKSGP